jgi:hypothetical protein
MTLLISIFDSGKTPTWVREGVRLFTISRVLEPNVYSFSLHAENKGIESLGKVYLTQARKGRGES